MGGMNRWIVGDEKPAPTGLSTTARMLIDAPDSYPFQEAKVQVARRTMTDGEAVYYTIGHDELDWCLPVIQADAEHNGWAGVPRRYVQTGGWVVVKYKKSYLPQT
jgi:hypothetical protein